MHVHAIREIVKQGHLSIAQQSQVCPGTSQLKSKENQQSTVFFIEM